jgi:hypothetical protein
MISGIPLFRRCPGEEKTRFILTVFQVLRDDRLAGGLCLRPKELIAAMTKIHQYTIMCVPITSQMLPRRPWQRQAFMRSDEAGIRPQAPVYDHGVE